MNNKAKKLIAGVLALSIGVSGNGIVGFADEVNAKSAEQTINSETNEVGTNLEQNLSAKDESSTPSTEQAKSKDPAAKEFKPEEITLSVEAAHNPYLEQAVKDLNEFIKEYNSKATREEKREFAILKKERISMRLTGFFEEFERGVKGKFFENVATEILKFAYIDCCVSESPYLADIMKEIAEIQTIYDSKLTNKAKREVIEEELYKLVHFGKEGNNPRDNVNRVKFAYLRCLELGLNTKNKDKKSIGYKFQNVIDNAILLAVKFFITYNYFLPYHFLQKQLERCVPIENFSGWGLLYCTAVAFIKDDLWRMLFIPFSCWPSVKKLGKSFVKLFS